ncbi:MAG: imidazole glycerol phosphate synthase subunit HisH [Bacteroidetes bacterium]|nr:MAG: imidazole glycerol phosphate synthase subunit HisH [Bacteroidota bacterium]TAE62060.1 MAG: imidazole glycerol phosphate synthase subunit HisH [Bacteroidota bacterium]
MSKVVVLQYNAGNTQSVLFALERLGITAELSNHAETILAADKVIFPGVGEASTAMRYLQQHGLHQLIPTLTQPVLGVCLGMQLLCQSSEENNTKCLGIFDTEVIKFPLDGGEKVPHMGWNNISMSNSILFQNIPANAYVYFVHSYYAKACNATVATANYIVPFSAALQKNNFYGVQFHPEKSAAVGATIIENFIKSA